MRRFIAIFPVVFFIVFLDAKVGPVKTQAGRYNRPACLLLYAVTGTAARV